MRTGDATATAPGRRVRDSELPRSGDILAGRFLIREELGRGGSGVVYRSVDLALGEPVALKVLRAACLGAEQRARLRREVSVSRSGHPNAVAIHELVEDGEWVALAMDLVDGVSAREALRERGRLGIEQTVGIGVRVASALAHLHARGVVHRDVKPANIMLGPGGEAMLCDMGLARSLAPGETVTETEMVVGTPAYMAPEQATAETLTPAADVYALGITLYHCLTGRVPLESSTALATMMLRSRSRPPRLRLDLPGAPSWLGRLLRQMLEPVARDRPSAAEVERSLRRRRHRWRPTRRLLARAALTVFAAASVAIGATALVGDEAVRMEVREGEIVGLDEHGDVGWSHPLGGPVRDHKRGDLDGDGVDELVVATFGRPQGVRRDADDPGARIEVLRLDGTVMTSIRVLDHIEIWDDRYPPEAMPTPWLADLDGLGGQELVVVCVQGNYFPAAVLVYWPQHELWEQVLLHTGHVYSVAAAPADGRPGLRFLAVNNRLAMQPVVGDLELSRPDRRSSSGTSAPLGSPEEDVGASSRVSWRFYTVLPDRTGPGVGDPPEVRVLPDGSTSVMTRGAELRLDRLGNPVPGPNAGRDLRSRRLELLDRIAGLRVDTELSGYLFGVDAARRELAHLSALAEPLVAEDPYRIVLLERTARVLARAGLLDEAVDRLAAGAAALPSDELQYRLANLEAVAGRFEDAADRVRRLAAEGRTQRAAFDAPILALRLAVVLRDEALVDQVARRLAVADLSTESRRELLQAFRARARLWLDGAPFAGDLEREAFRYQPEAPALSCLFRWRTGRSRPDDPEAMEAFLDANPDAVDVGRAAWAAALLGTGRPAEALDLLEGALAILEPDARDDYDARQTWDLMRALRAVALAEIGRTEEARLAAETVRRDVADHLLPAILAAEVVGG